MIDRVRLREAWCAETSYWGRFDPNRPSEGQCVPTALLVQDLCGGELRGCRVGQSRHFYNVIDGRILDLTANQFEASEYVQGLTTSCPKDRKDLLKQAEIRRRYEILKERYEKSKSSS